MDYAAAVTKPTLFTTTEFVTPERARTWLAANTDNYRPLDVKAVNKYARDMLSGVWRLNHQGIAFADSGRLADGQHRLHAIVKAGVGVFLRVTYGVETDQGMDEGKVRNVATILAGQYDIKDSNAVTAAVNAIREVISGDRNSISTNETLDLYRKFHDGIQFGIESTRSSLFRKRMLYGMFALAWTPKNQGAIRTFAKDVMDESVGLASNSPALALRKYVLRQTYKSDPSNTQSLKVLNAIHKHIHGQTVTGLTAADTKVVDYFLNLQGITR